MRRLSLLIHKDDGARYPTGPLIETRLRLLEKADQDNDEQKPFPGGLRVRLGDESPP